MAMEDCVSCRKVLYKCKFLNIPEYKGNYNLAREENQVADGNIEGGRHVHLIIIVPSAIIRTMMIAD